jgi:tetratricopeptide (TPR) repeat protein
MVLNLPEQSATDTNIQFQAVLKWLKQHPGWFLIIDNADTPASRKAASDLLSLIPNGHVVITSRLADWPAGVTPLDLDVLSEDSSVEFLLERTEGRRIRKDDDDKIARSIARTLDCLALALEQAAAYIRHRRCSLADFLRDWESRRPHVLRWHSEENSRYPRSIAVTYETSVAQLTDDARKLFEILSWIAPDPMPMRHLENLTALPDPRALLVELCDLHLATLSADGASFTIHRLLQEITRQQQTEAPPPALLTALEWLNAEMPQETYDVRTWPIAVPLLPHALAAATPAADRDIPTPTTRLLNQCALLLKTQANYPAAEPHYRRALAMAEKHLGEKHAETATYLNNLAQLLKATNRLAEAEPLMRRALAIDEASFGKDHPKVAIDLNNLAGLLHATNRLAEAEPLMRRALTIFETSFGKDHPNLAIRLNNLALLLQATNRLAEAEPLMRRALAIDEASFGKDHPEVATDLNNLATLLQDTNRLGEAEPLMRRSLVIWEDSYGRDHPHVAMGLNNLAMLLQATDRLAEAEPMMERAWRIFEDSLGREHPNTVTVAKNLAILRKEMGK